MPWRRPLQFWLQALRVLLVVVRRLRVVRQALLVGVLRLPVPALALRPLWREGLDLRGLPERQGSVPVLRRLR